MFSFPSSARGRWTVRLGALVAMILPACGESPPTAPPHPDSQASQIATDLRVGLVAAIADARNRIVPALGAGDTTVALASALDNLAAVFTRNRSFPESALQQAEQAVDALQTVMGRDAGRAADLAAVGLVLERAANLNASQAGSVPISEMGRKP